MAVVLDPAVLQDILLALRGVTVLEKPRVSKHVMVETLRQHTLALQDVQKEMLWLKSNLLDLLREHRAYQETMQRLEPQVNAHEHALTALTESTTSLKAELDEKFGDIQMLKRIVHEQGDLLARTTADWNSYKQDITNCLLDWNQRLVQGEKQTKEIKSQLQQMNAEIAALPETLQLPAESIIFHIPPDDEPGPMPLPDVIQKHKSKIEATQEAITGHNTILAQLDERFNGKADIVVSGMVESLMRDVAALQARAKREEEEGINEVRKHVETLQEQVEKMSLDIEDKVDRQNLDIIIHAKYEDIILYLKDALRVSEDDEAAFQMASQEMNERINKLQNVKADKAELNTLRELVIQAEASMYQLNNRRAVGPTDGNEEEAQAGPLVEVLQVLAGKADRAEVERMYQDILRKMKKRGETRSNSPEAGASRKKGGNQTQKGKQNATQNERQQPAGRNKAHFGGKISVETTLPRVPQAQAAGTDSDGTDMGRQGRQPRGILHVGASSTMPSSTGYQEGSRTLRPSGPHSVAATDVPGEIEYTDGGRILRLSGAQGVISGANGSPIEYIDGGTVRVVDEAGTLEYVDSTGRTVRITGSQGTLPHVGSTGQFSERLHADGGRVLASHGAVGVAVTSDSRNRGAPAGGQSGRNPPGSYFNGAAEGGYEDYMEDDRLGRMPIGAGTTLEYGEYVDNSRVGRAGRQFGGGGNSATDQSDNAEGGRTVLRLGGASAITSAIATAPEGGGIDNLRITSLNQELSDAPVRRPWKPGESAFLGGGFNLRGAGHPRGVQLTPVDGPTTRLERTSDGYTYYTDEEPVHDVSDGQQADSDDAGSAFERVASPRRLCRQSGWMYRKNVLID